MRELGLLVGGAFAAPLAAACAGGPPERLDVGPAMAPEGASQPGLQPLGLESERDGVLYVPAGADARMPLILMLHGVGGSGLRASRLLAAAAEATGCVVVAPDSRGRTWDALLGGFGPDVRFIERALATVGAGFIAPGQVAVAGFSDGVTYALGLGRANGSLFSHILAFSPGFVLASHPVGRPDIYVSHGRSDQVLPIDACSRVLVPELRRGGYDVRYREFDGRHAVPRAVALEAVRWFRNPASRRNTPLPR